MRNNGSTGTRVLVVAGWGRCGSTLLDMLLGEIEGFVSAGEVRELWLRGCVEDRPCGCGDPFSRCSFWTQVGQLAFGGWDQLDLQRILRARYRWDRPWGLPRLLGRPAADGVPSDVASIDRDDVTMYTETLARLMTAIAAVSGASVVVDSSKIPTHTLLLARSADLDVRVVHLVRDSRGVAFSNQKHVVKTATTGEPTLLPRYGAVSSAFRYDFYNATNGMLARRFGSAWLRLRYEDLVRDPATRLTEVARHAQEDADHDLPFLDGRRVTLAGNHIVDGNPVRFARQLTLRVDDEWRRRLSDRDRRTMTVLTWPLLRRYAYRGRRS
jgi:hypothetical protein